MSELLADLRTDLRVRTDGPAAAAHAHTADTAARTAAGRDAAPAVVVRLTPTRWSRPAVAVSGRRWSLVTGPVQVEITL